MWYFVDGVLILKEIVWPTLTLIGGREAQDRGIIGRHGAAPIRRWVPGQGVLAGDWVDDWWAAWAGGERVSREYEREHGERQQRDRHPRSPPELTSALPQGPARIQLGAPPMPSCLPFMLRDSG